jgi:hypothetical protein
LDPITDALTTEAVSDLAASAATTVAIGGALNLATNAALSGGQVGWRDVGFSLGFAAVGLVSELDSYVIGQDGEDEGQDGLELLGRYTEQDWYAYTDDGHSPVQLDLVDRSTGDTYDVKKGIPNTGLAQAMKLERQTALIGKTVRLQNSKTGEVIPEFVVKSVTWVNVLGLRGEGGFHDYLKGDIIGYGATWLYLY